MTKLPRDLSGREVIRALEKAGFYVKRQKGSHIVVRRDRLFAQVVVPAHRRIDTGTLHAIISASELSAEEFLNLL